MRNANISTYSAGTNIDGGNSGMDTWIEFGFTEESLKGIYFRVISGLQLQEILQLPCMVLPQQVKLLTVM
jgi:hypothetical protein